MTRLATLAAACCAIAAVAIVPAQAKKDQPDRSDWFEPCQIDYLDAYEKAHAKGFDVGANLVDDHDAGCDEIAESTARLKRWLNPAPVAAPTESEYVAPAPTSTVAPTSGGCPASMAGEASSPSAVNPSSGAAGCYQVIPSTAAAMGSACADVNAVSCMEAICAAQGNDAWVAADPCKSSPAVKP